METLKIVTYPDTFLSKPTLPVENIDGDIQKLIDHMAETMYQAPGVGLAAIQVGHGKSIIVFDDHPDDDNRSLQVLINPTIVQAEGSVLSENEGCLSVPEFRADVKRHAAVLVEGYDREGKPIRMERDDFLAIVLQHEIDHLNGTLFIDRISSLKRQLYKRKVQKQIKGNG
ncbi:MAG: peptide deformylase [Thermodesulfobacteriota bacterium]